MDEQTRHALLKLARDSITAALRRLPEPPLPVLPPADAGPPGGVFVTLRNAGRLRGCIGRFDPGCELAEAVREVAASVLDDPRFRVKPVTADELPQLNIEVSVLSPMQRTADPASLKIGVHGIYVSGRGRGGCFLPQVASEQGWTAEQFLSQCCSGKAGLPADAWRDRSHVEVYLFTSEAFAEGRPGSPGSHSCSNPPQRG